ncbi:MAG: hypothetical protein ACOY3Y_13405 [Acidobacteriota bacterium]
MTITLINTTRRMKVINLPHDIYCAAAGRCACAAASGRGGRRIASSLTLPAGSATPGLDEAVLLVLEVARDVRAGELRVRREAPVPKNTNPSRKALRRSGRKNER